MTVGGVSSPILVKTSSKPRSVSIQVKDGDLECLTLVNSLPRRFTFPPEKLVFSFTTLFFV